MVSQGLTQTLTPLELRLMQVLWRLGPATVAAVQEHLPPPKLAYTTIQTMLNILERKGKLERTLQGRAFLYRPTVSESGALTHAVRDLIDRMFGGSGEALVMNLLETRQLTPERLAALSEQLQALESPSSASTSPTPDPEEPQS